MRSDAVTAWADWVKYLLLPIPPGFDCLDVMLFKTVLLFAPNLRVSSAGGQVAPADSTL